MAHGSFMLIFMAMPPLLLSNSIEKNYGFIFQRFIHIEFLVSSIILLIGFADDGNT